MQALTAPTQSLSESSIGRTRQYGWISITLMSHITTDTAYKHVCTIANKEKSKGNDPVHKTFGPNAELVCELTDIFLSTAADTPEVVFSNWPPERKAPDGSHGSSRWSSCQGLSRFPLHPVWLTLASSHPVPAVPGWGCWDYHGSGVE